MSRIQLRPTLQYNAHAYIINREITHVHYDHIKSLFL
jgi:hypothetical protein